MSDEQNPQQDLPIDYQPWPGARVHRLFFHPTPEDLRDIRNEEFRQDLCRKQSVQMFSDVMEQARAPRDPDLPKITSAELADYTKIVDRCKDPNDWLKSGLVSDYPITATDLCKLTGSKSRNNYQSLIRKGLLHSYGMGKGAVPAWIRRPPPTSDRIEWFALTPLQRRILFCFDRKTCCCRSAEFEQLVLKAPSWREAPLRDGVVGLLGTQIAIRLGVDYEVDKNFRDALAGLVKVQILLKGRTSRRSKTHVGYVANPPRWPSDPRARPFCPAVDVVNSMRRWRGQSDLPAP